MGYDCEAAFESIHEELVEIARKAARLLRDTDMPEDEHCIRSAIYQTLVDHQLVPPRIMTELEKHTRRTLAEMRGN